MAVAPDVAGIGQELPVEASVQIYLEADIGGAPERALSCSYAFATRLVFASAKPLGRWGNSSGCARPDG